MRRRAALALAGLGTAFSAGADVYTVRAPPYGEWAIEPGVVIWLSWPFWLIAILALVTRLRIGAAALAAIGIAGMVAFASWAEVDDLQSSDPSSTGSLAFLFPPIYGFVLLVVVAAVDAVLRARRDRRTTAAG